MGIESDRRLALDGVSPSFAKMGTSFRMLGALRAIDQCTKCYGCAKGACWAFFAIA